jgi:SAM-dependent methyltransferase
MSAVKIGTFPELVAGGFTRNDGAIEFFSRVHSLLPPGAVILDFGAGRGEWGTEDTVEYRRRLWDFRAEDRRVIGVDVDPVILENPLVDEAHVLSDHHLPLADESVDIIVAEWVFEHIDDPEGVAAELSRVLRPGGWICARTPNRYGYIALGGRLIPNRAHSRVLRRLQPSRQAIDVFPTRYRMNTRSQLVRLFPPERFTHGTYGPVVDPLYFGRSRTLVGLVRTLSRFLPEALAPVWCVFIRRDR